MALQPKLSGVPFVTLFYFHIYFYDSDSRVLRYLSLVGKAMGFFMCSLQLSQC